MEKNTQKKHKNTPGYTPDVGKRSYALSIWIGALIRWTATFGTKKFNDFYRPESNTKNLLVGYLATLLFVTILMTILIYYNQ